MENCQLEQEFKSLAGKQELLANINHPFPEKTNYLELLRNICNFILESNDPDMLIYAINLLRRLEKHEKEFFMRIFDNIYDSFDRLIFNQNKEVVHAAFLFLIELFSQFWQGDLISRWVDYLLPKVILSSTSNNLDQDIAQMGHTILEKISTCGYYVDAFNCLINALKTDDLQTLNTFSNFLNSFLRSCDKIILINYFEWNDIFIDLFSVISPKRMDLVKGIIYVLQNEILTKEEFNEILVKLDSDIIDQLLFLEIKFDYNEIKKQQQLNENN